ncbi:MAG: ubiquitin-conjugating enzyme E2 variant [Candidatus Heimdallarchaeaceae archaeon]
MPVPDDILAKEYSLVMERAYAFEPIEGDLTRWRGVVPAVTDDGEIFIEVIIVLPSDFPESPPVVRVLSPVTHPNLTQDKVLEMRMLARWRSSYHLFQIIVEMIRLFSKVPARSVDEQPQRIDPVVHLNPIKAQEEQLSMILEQKKEALVEIRSKRSSDLSRRALQQEKKIHFDDEILGVENELFAIEQQFEDYEIPSHEFAKKYFNLKKRLYLLEARS